MTRLPHIPMRTCVGCRSCVPQSDLHRVVAAANGEIAVDPRGSAPGRGAWIHADQRCLTLAHRKDAWRRALRLRETPDVSPVSAALVAFMTDERGAQ